MDIIECVHCGFLSSQTHRDQVALAIIIVISCRWVFSVKRKLFHINAHTLWRQMSENSGTNNKEKLTLWELSTLKCNRKIIKLRALTDSFSFLGTMCSFFRLLDVRRRNDTFSSSQFAVRCSESVISNSYMRRKNMYMDEFFVTKRQHELTSKTCSSQAL